MSPFLQAVDAACDALALSAVRILVGVSGGADSVALLRSLHEVSESRHLQLHAAHLNHGLRAHAADEDAVWTSDLCGRLGVPCTVEQIDVPRRASADGLNLEEAARIARYEFFERTARALGCAHVAVAHTADDRVETVLHNLLRGTGLAGLCSLRPSRPLAEGLTLVRPLLGTSRREIESWLLEIGQDFRTDATNFDESRTRNRIRRVLLPSLERDFGPQVRDSLLRLSDQADDVQTAIEQLANQLLDSCLEDDSSEICRLNASRLTDQPRHLVRETFVALWKRKGWPRQAMGFEDWERICRLVKEGGVESLPGRIEAKRRGTLIVLERRRAGS